MNTIISNETKSVMNSIKDFPTTLVEIKIIQSILSSKLISMDKPTIEKLINVLIHNIKNVFDKLFDKIDCIAFKIDILKSDIFTYDFIQHRLIIIGNGFEDKLPLLKEKLESFVKSKMGDSFSLIVNEEQSSDEVYTYFNNQSINSTNRSEFESEKMLKFYHPDLYSISEQGWIILNPTELDCLIIP